MGLGSPGPSCVFLFSKPSIFPEVQGDVTAWQWAPRAPAAFTKGLSTDGKSGRQVENTAYKFRRQVFKSKCWIFNILNTTLLGKVIPMEEAGWVTWGATQWYFLQLGHVPWPSSWGENAMMVLRRQLSWVAVAMLLALGLLCVCPFCVWICNVGSSQAGPMWLLQLCLELSLNYMFIFFLTCHFDFIYLLSQIQIWKWKRLIKLDSEMLAQCYCGSGCFILLWCSFYIYN